MVRARLPPAADACLRVSRRPDDRAATAAWSLAACDCRSGPTPTGKHRGVDRAQPSPRSPLRLKRWQIAKVGKSRLPAPPPTGFRNRSP